VTYVLEKTCVSIPTGTTHNPRASAVNGKTPPTPSNTGTLEEVVIPDAAPRRPRARVVLASALPRHARVGSKDRL
jgi:hypothetical protein